MNKNRRKIIIKILYLIGVAGGVVTLVFFDKIFGESSIFQETVSTNNFVQWLYQKIPAVIGTIMVVLAEMSLYYVLQIIASKVTKKLGSRSVTIAKLIFSSMRWIFAIIGLLLTLAVWGVDTTALLASAGILTLIIGLGANQLVADIIAGVFIVFEGDFDVGDIVVINDWRGTVKEIGIRTTKLEDAGGNINIINNAEIKTVINQTDELSLAKCIISIPYSASLPEVEEMIKENLEDLKEEIPTLIGELIYKGVDSLSPSSVDLLFVGKCKEDDIFQTQRDMNRAFKILCDKKHISIPLPQVTISYLKDENQK